jgi:alkylation response protein AidB-like acyl-CoA dehydrogenase
VTTLAALVHSQEERTLVETVAALADGPLARAGDDEVERIAAARDELVTTGLWALGLPEAAGGGGADGRTVALVTSALAAAWPALAVAVSHVHAAGALLADVDDHQDLLREVAAGRAVAVVDLPAGVSWEQGATIALPRIDVATDRAHVLVLVDDSSAAVVPAEVASFGDVLRRTGLDGARTVPVSFTAKAALQLTSVPVAEARRVLFRGLTAVAAGIADAAARGATAYAEARVQFGGPLTALPAVRDTLFRLGAGATSASTVALADPPDVVAAAELLDQTLELAIEVAADGVQAHGGYGYLTEYPAEGRLRDAVSLRAAADAVGMRERTARAALAPRG